MSGNVLIPKDAYIRAIQLEDNQAKNNPNQWNITRSLSFGIYWLSEGIYPPEKQMYYHICNGENNEVSDLFQKAAWLKDSGVLTR